MSSISNLKIGSRLGLAFAAVLLITTAISIVGVWKLASLNQANKQIVSVELDRSLLSQQWAGQIRLNWVRAAAALKTTDMAYIESLQKEMSATSQSISDKQKKLEAMTDDLTTKQLMESVAKARSAYVGARAELIKKQKAGEEISGAVDRDLRPLADVYLGEVDRVADRAEQVLEGVQSKMDSLVSSSELTLGLGAAAAVLLGAWLAWMVTRAITRPIAQAVLAAEAISGGNLAYEINVQGQDETAQLLQALSAMRDQLGAIVGQVRSGSQEVASASAEIAQGNQELSTRTEQQSQSLQETSSSMDRLNATVQHNADNARQANQLAMAASTVAAKGGEVVNQVVGTMRGIHDSSKKINDIISVIDGIAFQTNILALNAAVEAARAGEQGRGFAVVASEVRSLAGRSATAAKEIKTLIGDSVERVERGSALVDQAGVTMSEVVDSIKRVTDLMSEISMASHAQSQGFLQVGDAVTHMDSTTQQNAALVEEMAAAAASLNSQSQTLVNTVGMFKLADHMLVATPASLPVRALAARQQRRPAVSHTKPAAVRSTAARRPTSRVAAAPAPALGSVKKTTKPQPATADDEWESF